MPGADDTQPGATPEPTSYPIEISKIHEKRTFGVCNGAWDKDQGFAIMPLRCPSKHIGMTDTPTKTKPDPATWVDEHGDVLYRFALLRVKDPHVAEDLVQEALIAGLEGLNSYKGGSSVQTWLVGILKHKIYDYFRKSTREISTSDVASATEETEEEAVDRLQQASPRAHPWHESPYNLMENKEFWKVFLGCLEGLPENFRRAFALRELDGLKTADICKILGITSTNLWVILHRTRSRLRDCLDASWFRDERR